MQSRSQTTTVSGRLLDEGSGQPVLNNAGVSFVNSSGYTTVGASVGAGGAFQITTLSRE